MSTTNFRKPNTPSPISASNFGVGSIIQGSIAERYLVVSTSQPMCVTLLDLGTFTVKHPVGMKVQDPSWMTLEEAGELTKLTGLPYTRSDFDFLNAGLKNK